MKLASFRRPDDIARWGLVTDAGIIDLGSESGGLATGAGGRFFLG